MAAPIPEFKIPDGFGPDVRDLSPERGVVTIPEFKIPAGFGPKVKDLSPEKAAGVNFLHFLLWVVTIVVFFQLIVLIVAMRHYWCLASVYDHKLIEVTVNSTNLTPETVKAAADSIQSQQKSFQDFWLQTTQFVLSTIFLPLITALLGYIFGTKEASSSEK